MATIRFSGRTMNQQTAANHYKIKTGKAICRKLIPGMLPVKTETLFSWKNGSLQ